MCNTMKTRKINNKSYQCVFLCVGQLGGNEVLNGGQQHNDQCTDESAGPQQVIQQQHTHNDLKENKNMKQVHIKYNATFVTQQVLKSIQLTLQVRE